MSKVMTQPRFGYVYGEEDQLVFDFPGLPGYKEFLPSKRTKLTFSDGTVASTKHDVLPSGEGGWLFKVEKKGSCYHRREYAKDRAYSTHDLPAPDNTCILIFKPGITSVEADHFAIEIPEPEQD